MARISPGAASAPMREWDKALARQRGGILKLSVTVAVAIVTWGSLSWFAAALSGSSVGAWNLCSGMTGVDARDVVYACLSAVATLSVALIAGPLLTVISSGRKRLAREVNRLTMLKWLEGLGLVTAILAATSNGVSIVTIVATLFFNEMADSCRAAAGLAPMLALTTAITVLACYAVRPDLGLVAAADELRKAELVLARERENLLKRARGTCTRS